MKQKGKKSPVTNRVIAYVRVSTSQQAAEGYSLEAQQAKLEAYAKLFELEIVATEVDAGVSAGTLDRPGLQRALARLDAFEASGILVVKLDRLTRSVRDLCSLVDTYFKDGNRLLSVHEQIDTGSAGGRMILSILTAVSQWEREAATERTTAVMKHMKESGKFCGGWPPFGYVVDDEGNLVEDVAEQAIILQAKALRANGGTLRSVASELGINPRTGNPFGATQIVRML